MIQNLILFSKQDIYFNEKITSYYCLYGMFSFAGCNKQTEPAASENTQTTTATNTANTTAPATTGSMTKDNHEDIRNDLNRLQALANSKAEAAIDYQDQMMKAVQANNREQVMDIMKKMQGFMTEFNGELKSCH